MLESLIDLEKIKSVRDGLKKFNISEEHLLAILLSKKPRLHFLISVGQPTHGSEFQCFIPYLIQVIQAARQAAAKMIPSLDLGSEVHIDFLIADTLQAYNVIDDSVSEQEILDDVIFEVGDKKCLLYWAAKGRQWKADLLQGFQSAGLSLENVDSIVWDDFAKKAKDFFQKNPSRANEEKLWEIYTQNKEFAQKVYEKICRYRRSVQGGHQDGLNDFDVFFESSLKTGTVEEGWAKYNVQELSFLYLYLAHEEGAHFLLYPSDASPLTQYCSRDDMRIGFGEMPLFKINCDAKLPEYSNFLNIQFSNLGKISCSYLVRPIEPPDFYVPFRKISDDLTYLEMIEAKFSQNSIVYLTGPSQSGKSQIAADYFLKNKDRAIWIGSDDTGSLRDIFLPKIKEYFGVVFKDASVKFLIRFLKEHRAGNGSLLIVVDSSSYLKGKKEKECKLLSRVFGVQWLLLDLHSPDPNREIKVSPRWVLADEAVVRGNPSFPKDADQLLRDRTVSEFQNLMKYLQEGAPVNFLKKIVGSIPAYTLDSLGTSTNNIENTFFPIDGSRSVSIGQSSALQWMLYRYSNYHRIVWVHEKNYADAIKDVDLFFQSDLLSSQKTPPDQISELQCEADDVAYSQLELKNLVVFDQIPPNNFHVRNYWIKKNKHVDIFVILNDQDIIRAELRSVDALNSADMKETTSPTFEDGLGAKSKPFDTTKIILIAGGAAIVTAGSAAFAGTSTSATVGGMANAVATKGVVTAVGVATKTIPTMVGLAKTAVVAGGAAAAASGAALAGTAVVGSTTAVSVAALAGSTATVASTVAGLGSTASVAVGLGTAGGVAAGPSVGTALTMLAAAGASPVLLPVAGFVSALALAAAGGYYWKSRMKDEPVGGSAEPPQNENPDNSTVPPEEVINPVSAFFKSALRRRTITQQGQTIAMLPHQS